MLVNNKFIYIALPRCASTAFYYSCLIQNIDVKHTTNEWVSHNSKIDFKNVPTNDLMNHIAHGHEKLSELENKFGKGYPIISVKRDRYSRFYSLYKHMLFDLKRFGADSIYKHFKELSTKDLFFFDKKSVETKKSRWDLINNYLIENKLIKQRFDISLTNKYNKNEEDYWRIEMGGYIINVIDTFITPQSFWHNNDNRIMWFEFGEFDKMEKWISNILNVDFKMLNVNSSSHMDSNVVMNDEFIKYYNDVYNFYDFPKLNNTII